jgi:hypothetical protein
VDDLGQAALHDADADPDADAHADPDAGPYADPDADPDADPAAVQSGLFVITAAATLSGCHMASGRSIGQGQFFGYDGNEPAVGRARGLQRQ